MYKYIQISPSFTRKNLICTERGLGKRLRLEDHKFKANGDFITMTMSLEGKREVGERMDEGNKRKKAKAGSKEGESFIVLDAQYCLPLLNGKYTAREQRMSLVGNTPNSR